MPGKTLGERVAALEATLPGLVEKVTEIGTDVKTLVAAHNNEQGAKEEKKRAEKRRLVTYSTAGGLFGAAVTALAELWKH